jgi:hypothetical protein
MRAPQNTGGENAQLPRSENGGWGRRGGGLSCASFARTACGSNHKRCEAMFVLLVDIPEAARSRPTSECTRFGAPMPPAAQLTPLSPGPTGHRLTRAAP